MNELTPMAIVAELDKHIVGQKSAKRAVAIALRNRWRRARVDKSIRHEITPRNILMIGPTGVGKTEIARRLAKLVNAPFIKIEATKFTEVGYVGRDVESIIRDLADTATKQIRESEKEKVQDAARRAAIERILDILLPSARQMDNNDHEPKENATREKFRQMLQAGKFDHKEIEVELNLIGVGVEIMAPPGMEEMTSQLQGMFQHMGANKKQSRKLKVKNALKVLTEEEAAELVNEEDIKSKAIESVEQKGIVFLDELDKVTRGSEVSGADISREGVQRDLLPLIEGNTVSTKYGMIKTDHILFIASGAFHLAKPSDLIPELQGRLPIRVELNALVADDFVRILTEPDASLTAQYIALMGVEGVALSFTEDGIRRIAEIASEVNESTENIGARRLHTVMERLLESLSFNASKKSGESICVDQSYVDQHLGELVEDDDLTRYIL